MVLRLCSQVLENHLLHVLLLKSACNQDPPPAPRQPLSQGRSHNTACLPCPAPPPALLGDRGRPSGSAGVPSSPSPRPHRDGQGTCRHTLSRTWPHRQYRNLCRPPQRERIGRGWRPASARSRPYRDPQCRCWDLRRCAPSPQWLRREASQRRHGKGDTEAGGSAALRPPHLKAQCRRVPHCRQSPSWCSPCPHPRRMLASAVPSTEPADRKDEE